MLPRVGGYINDAGVLNRDRAEAYLTELGKYEDSVFRQRVAEDAAQARRRSGRKRHEMTASEAAAAASVTKAPSPKPGLFPVSGGAGIVEESDALADAEEDLAADV